MQFPAKRWIRKWIRPGSPPAEVAGEAGGRESLGGACVASAPAATAVAVASPTTLLDRLLAERGVSSAEDREAFLRPNTFKQVQLPWHMHGVEEAARTVHEAIRARRRIAIYGDYDVDGVMGTAVLWHAIRTVCSDLEVRTYIPHRRREGYGLNADALHRLRDEGIEVVVTVDCGVSAVDEAEVAAQQGLELVITDHHSLRPDGAVPRARAVVHPRLGSTQRFGELCGAMVAWKVAWALFYEAAGCSRDGKLPAKYGDRLLRLMPLAAVGTIADVMPLLGENRAIVAMGLPRIHSTGIDGFDALLRHVRLGPDAIAPERIDAEAIAFRLAPPINASGRMQHAEDALELFTTAHGERIHGLVKILDRLNEQRKKEGGEIASAAQERWKAIATSHRAEHGRSPAAVVLHDESWNLGIVGIVCSKLVESFARPAVLLTRDIQEGSEFYKGSGRSVPGVDLHAALASCSETLVSFGGHAMAAGLKVHASRLDEFTRAFDAAVAAQRPCEEEPRSEIAIDCALALDGFSIGAMQEIEQLQPFGRGNPRPTVLIEEVEVTQVRPLGRDGRHFELIVREKIADQFRHLSIKWWRSAELISQVPVGSRIDAVVEPSVSVFRGVAEVSVTLVDLDVRLAGISAKTRREGR